MPHINEKLDHTVEVFIVYQNKVLLRIHDKYNIWLSIGGHIEPGEDHNEAAIREAKEEVGLEIILTTAHPVPFSNTDMYKELVPPRFSNRHRINDTHEHATFVYFATTKNPTILIGPHEKNMPYKWFTESELHDPQYHLKEDILFYAKTALQELKKK